MAHINFLIWYSTPAINQTFHMSWISQPPFLNVCSNFDNFVQTIFLYTEVKKIGFKQKEKFASSIVLHENIFAEKDCQEQ